MPVAQDLYELAEDLRIRVEEAYAAKKWANDNQFAQSFEELAVQAASAFPDDPIVGQLQVSVPRELDSLIAKDPSCVTAWVRMQAGRLSIRLRQHAHREAGSTSRFVDLDLSFMQDDYLRHTVATDFTEAQRSFFADAPKAAAVLCGGVIEGMLLDVLNRPRCLEDARFREFLQGKGTARIDWNRASLKFLLELAEALGLIRPSACRLASSVADFRDTLHPANERRTGIRAGVSEASVLLQVVQMISSDLGSSALEAAGRNATASDNGL